MTFFVIIIPLGQSYFAYQNTVAKLETEVEINAGLVSGIISRNPTMWEFQRLRMEEYLMRRPANGEKEIRRVLNDKNEVVAESADELEKPLMMHADKLMDAGAVVGRIEIYRSMRPFLVQTGLVALLMLPLGLGIFLIICHLPIRAIHRAEEALRSSEKRAKRLAQENVLVAEMGRIISSTLNIDKVFEFFSKAVGELIPFDRIAINLRGQQEDDSFVRYVAGFDVAGRLAGTYVPLTGTATSECMRTKSALLLQPKDEKEVKELGARFPRFLPNLEAGIRSAILVPLITADQAIGTLTLRSAKWQAYTNQDVKLAESIASQIAGAVASAKVYSEQVQAEEALRKSEVELRRSRDVLETKVQERTKDLALAKEAAEASSRAKSEFLANMSHELRTPLNHIIGFTDLVANKQCGELNPEQEEYLKDVLESGQHLLALINDILDLSKVEAGKLTLEADDLYLRPLLENSLTMVKEKASTHRIRLSTEFDGIPEVIQGDERKLKQILYNLLSNAVKFTPDGGSVRLKASRISDLKKATEDSAIRNPHSAIEISVEDSGIGIKGEDLRRIFAPFEQADNTASRRYQGTGLGLSLTKRLVELLGGRIWAESAGERKGSKFIFIIPVETGVSIAEGERMGHGK